MKLEDKMKILILIVLLSTAYFYGAIQNQSQNHIDDNITPTPLNKTLNNTLNKTVQVYYDDTSGTAYKKIRYDLVTDIVWAYIRINGDGSLNYDDYGDPTGLISLAHNNGVRVHLSFQEMSGEADKILSDPNVRTNAINNLISEVKKRGFDGIDNDIETASSSQRDHMTIFMKQLYNTFKEDNSSYRVSVAVSALNWGNVFDGPVIKDYVDYLMIMAYFWDEKNPISGPMEPMLQDDNSEASVITSIKYWHGIENIPVNKTLLGIPYYGYNRETDSGERLANVNGDVVWVHLDSIPEYYHYNRYFDPVWKTPWQIWSKDGQWHQLHYEDVESLAYKYDKVNSDNLAGIGIWNINYAINRSDLWQLIDDKFSKNSTR